MTDHYPTEISRLLPVGSEQTQRNGQTRIRQVRVLAHTTSTVHVRALNGPLRGTEYDLRPDDFRTPGMKGKSHD